MNALVYCIAHEEMSHMECGELCGHIHYVPVYDDGGVPIGVDVEFCTYDLGYTFCPPPAVDPDWIDNVVEPGIELPLFFGDLYFDPTLPEEAVYLLPYYPG